MRVSSWLGAGLMLALLFGFVSPVGAQYFGKNKVQYKSHRWQVLETKHFDVYYYDGERETALDAARMAERSYRRLTTLLSHWMRDKIPLILYASHADFQATNITPGLIGEGTGGVTEFLKRRVFLPFTGSYAELEHVLTHELIHAFQIDMLYGRGGGALVGNPFAYQPPLWVMEGSAEYLSLGGVDANTEMWLRDGALQGYLTPIPVLNHVYDIRVYRYGQSLFEYISRRFGPDKVGILWKQLARTHDLDRSLRYVTGMSLEKLSEAWTEDVRRAYLPQIADHQKPSDFARALTEHERDLSSMNVVPAVSPAGDKVAYVSDRDLNRSIYLVSALDGEDLGRLVDGERSGDLESLRYFSSSIDWSPDGRFIAFPAKTGGRDAIYVYDVERRRRVKKIDVPLDGLASPSWSPDGRRFVFAGFSGGRSDLYLIDADGGGLQQLTRDRYSALSPRFSPDGGTIVFTTDRGPDTDLSELVFGPPRLALYHVESKTIEVLPGQAGKNISPHFSADGAHLLFVSDRTGISNLYRTALATGETVRLTDILTGITGITAGSPPVSLSRDGRRLVFSAFERGGWNLYAVKDPLMMAPVDTVYGESAVASVTRVHFPEGLGRLAERHLAVTEAAKQERKERRSEVADTLVTVLRRPEPGFEVGPRPRVEVTGDDGGAPAFADSASRVDRPGDFGAPDDEGAFVSLRPRGAGLSEGAPPPNADSLRAALSVLPDTASFVDRSYRTRFTADYGSAGAGFASNVGLAGQAYVGFSDVLGNKNMLLGASVYGSLSDADLFFQYANLGHRINWGFAAYQFRNDFLLSTAKDSDEFQSNIYRGGQLLLSRPFNMFSRVEFGLEGVAISRRVFEQQHYYDPDPTQLRDEGTVFYVAPSVAWVKDTAFYGSTGPIKGARSRLEVRQGIGGASFTDVTVDLRRYLNLRQRYSVAGRIIGATSFGEDPQVYRVGGPFTLRAVDYGEMEGSHLLLTNLEFRFPFVERLDFGWPLPLGLRGIRGVLFFDAGAAWGETYAGHALTAEELEDQRVFTPFSREGGFRLDDLKAAYGFGVRINLGFLLVRWDLAQATDLRRNLGPTKGYFTLGGEF